ncbi:MAG: ABC transporter substrate-binding protein [Fervidicoccaceae archaeon]
MSRQESGPRVHRSSAIAIAAVAVVVAIALAAYVATRGPTATPSPTLTPTPTPTPAAKVLVVGTTYDPKTLDPHMAYDIASAMVIQNLYDTLTGYEPGTANVAPKLAERWEPNENATIWTYYLRRNVKFHDGTLLTAELVKSSVERAKALGGPASFLLDVVESVEVVDAYTVRFVLKYPFAPFPALTTFILFAPVPPNATDLEARPVGTGPFKLESWVKGQYIVLTANKDYWRGSPKVDKIVIKFYPDPTTLRIALEKGEVDIALGVQPSDVPILARNSNIKTLYVDGLVIEWMGMNQRRAPLDNVLLRKAINYAIDYDYILDKILNKAAVRLYGPLPPGVFGYDPEVEKYGYRYDLELASRMLAQAGYPEGRGLRELELIISTEERPERGEVAALIQHSLKQIGINVKIVDLDWSTFLDRLFRYDFDLYMVDWFPDYVDPDDWIVPLFSTEGLNIDGYSNPKVDELALLARQTADSAKRLELYRELQRIIVDDAPWVFLYVPKMYAFTGKNVEGFVLYPAYYIDFYPVYKTG